MIHTVDSLLTTRFGGHIYIEALEDKRGSQKADNFPYKCFFLFYVVGNHSQKLVGNTCIREDYVCISCAVLHG